MMPHLTEVMILSECGKGEVVFLLGIHLIPTDVTILFTRLHFAVNVMFIINPKDRFVSVAGRNLEESCFSHG